MKKQLRALLLFSGGLDSMLAAKVLEKQNIQVTGLTFVSYFFDATQAKKSAREMGLKLIVKEFSDDHLGIIKKPKYARGKGLNPCIDCHALMLKFAQKVALEEGALIIATGEVLGQRPLSQNKNAMAIIEKEAKLEGRILRPLSAKLLESTIYEKEKLVSREGLFEIQGKGRGQQLKLAQEFGITDFPTPAGGCRLTEKEFSAKLQNLLDFSENQKKSDFQLIRFGRHCYFKFKNQSASRRTKVKNSTQKLKVFFHIILGRNKEENEGLEKLAEKGDWIVKRKDTLGPTALVRNIKGVTDTVNFSAAESVEDAIKEAKNLILKHSKKKTSEFFKFEI